ncbi:MAG: flavoprotein [Lysobacterales bacterium RIFOXYD1_FULL_69_11]|nr:MAG: flavoprotein [Xanthomonadales bacterium RIFOXYD1_FULL_69_11]
MDTALPVVVIGAGPVGLAAAAHLLERGLQPLVLEAGDGVGASMQRWAHVRMFSPWAFNIDRAARALLEAHGWAAPDPAGFPTGGEVVDRYLRPLAALPEIGPRLRLGARVRAVTRQRHDRMKDAHRADVPFQVHYEDAHGEHAVLAQAVVDASGTLRTPNPMGASGVPALGERALAHRIAYGMPDVLGRERARYAGKRVLVVGSGHSAFNVLQDLARLSEQAPDTAIQWALRRGSLRRVLGGGDADQLRERGALGQRIGALVDGGTVQAATGFHVERLQATDDGIVVLDGDRALAPVDEIVVATGFRPDAALLSELRIALDHGTQAPLALAPLIDPNLHSCGSVRPHGAVELAHPDPGVYIVGMKSYGRAPTFLLATGYEQVRSVAAALAGDWDAARRVELVLPETGVCITHFADEEAADTRAGCSGTDPAPFPGCATSCGATAALPPAIAAGTEARDVTACCGGPAEPGVEACCRRDAEAKAARASGCGCSEKPDAVVAARCCA